MSKQKIVTGKASTIPMGLLCGTSICVLISIVAALITAWLINTEIISDKNIGVAAMITLILSAAGGAGISVYKIKRLRMQVSILTGILYYLTLIAMTALIFGGQYEGMVTTAIAVMCGSGSVALISVTGKRREKHLVRKHKYR